MFASLLALCLSTTSLAQIPQRIIPLSPALAELTADLLGDQLDFIVGVTEYTDEPPGLLKKPKVGPYTRVHLETVLSLKPDLIVASPQGNAKDQVERLQKLGVKVLVVENENVEDIPKALEKLGQALGREKEAQILKKRFQNQLEEITARGNRRREKDPKPLKVVFQVGWNPLIVVGGRGFLQESMKKLGILNPAETIPQAFPKVSVEAVLSWKPDRVLVLSMGKDETREKEAVLAWKKLRVNATLHRNDALARPSLRLVRGLAQLEKELFKE